MTDEMLSIAEAARRLGVSGHMIKEIIDAKEIHTFKPYPNAKRQKVWASELDRYVRAKRSNCEVSR